MNEYEPPPPTEAKNEYGPYFSMALTIWSLASSMASSQEMTSHLFSPRSPARLIGWMIRRGLYMVCSWFRPFRHRLPRLTGASGSPSSFVTTPFST